MKLKTLSAVAGLGGALIMSGQANAAYVGLGLRLHTVVNLGGTNRSVWRVYALFNNPGDYVTAIAGSDTVGNLVIQSRNATDTAAGSNFFNAGGGDGTPPTDNLIGSVPNARWDTFATIGVDVDIESDPLDDQTGVSPGFPPFITGNSLSNNNMAWFTPGPIEQGRAGGPHSNLGPFTNGGAPVVGLGILIMQLTVNAGDNVRGTVSVSGSLDTIGIAGLTSFTMNGQTFNSFAIPAPGALALLGLAGLVGSRRRRA